MWLQVEGTMAWEVRRGLEGMRRVVSKGHPSQCSA